MRSVPHPAPHAAPIPVTFSIINLAPGYLTENYEHQVKMICARGLQKRGYIEAGTQTPRYHFVIEVSIDTSVVRLHRLVGSPLALRQVKGIVFRYNLFFYHSPISYWSFSNDLFLFENERRDLSRSKSMINYALRHIPAH